MTPNDPIYQEIALYHYVIGGMLADTDFRRKALEVLPEVGQPETDQGIAAIAGGNADEVWRAFNQYGVVRGEGTVLEAILGKLSALLLKRQVRDSSARFSHLMNDWFSIESKHEAVKLQEVLKVYIEQCG